MGVTDQHVGKDSKININNTLYIGTAFALYNITDQNLISNCLGFSLHGPLNSIGLTHVWVQREFESPILLKNWF